MDFFGYKGANLHCEEFPLKELAAQYGTPLYVYSYRTLERHFRVFDEAMAGCEHLICYAVKANGNLALIRAIANFGGGADVVSGGELFRCFQAQMPASRIVFSGVGKSLPEIEYALRRRVKMINVESAQELQLVASTASAMNTKASVSFRFNPDIDAESHPYISTGLRDHKFGLNRADVVQLVKEAQKLPSVEVVGLAFHIGSQIVDTEPFVQAAQAAVELVRELRRLGAPIRIIDTGGGLGVRYTTETPPEPGAFARALLPLVKDLDLLWVVEPGRSLIGNAGILLTRVLSLKSNGEKQFVIVDAGMNDLIRPALYHAEHAIDPVVRRGGKRITADVVGPVCESGDFLARNREIEEPMEGDLLCVRTAGAYGFSMSSQYNARPRAAEVLVDGDRVDMIRARESFEDLVQGEMIPDWLESRP